MSETASQETTELVGDHDGTHESDAAGDVCGECGHAAKFHTPKPPHFCGACSCLGFREKPPRAASGA